MATIDEDAALDRMLDTLERWLASEVVPNVLELEHADEYPTEMVEQMREFGLFGATIPTEYGGLGLVGRGLRRASSAAISEVWMSLTGVLNSHLMMAAAHAPLRHRRSSARTFLPQWRLASCAAGWR